MCLSEYTEVLNETPDKFKSQLIVQEKNIFKITASFEDQLEQISMNSRTEAEKFEPETTFEKNIDDIKSGHMKIITSFDMNLLAINSDTPSSSSEHIDAKLMTYIPLQST